MNRIPATLAPSLSLFFITACAAGTADLMTSSAQGNPATGSASALVSMADNRPIEPLPENFSIPALSEMRLSGTGLTLDNVLAKNAAYTRYAIHYFSNGLSISGIMNIPAGEGPFPLIVLNHGYIPTAVYTRGRGLKREQDALARAGFAVLHTDYRGHADSDESPLTLPIYDGNIEYAMDSINAVLAARAAGLPHVDTRHVGMLGHSLGGGVTLAVLTARPDLVDAAVLYAPVHADVWENFTRWRAERGEEDRTIEAYGTREQNPALWDALSPQTYLGRIAAPILLFQGGRDPDVPPAWSDHLAEGLRAFSRNVTYVQYPEEGHEFSGQWQDFLDRSIRFFHETLIDIPASLSQKSAPAVQSVT